MLGYIQGWLSICSWLNLVLRNDYIGNTVRTKHDQIFSISNIFGITTIKVYESNIDDVIIRKIHLCSSKYVHQSLSMNLSSSKSTLDWWYITPSHCFIAFLLQRQTFVRISIVLTLLYLLQKYSGSISYRKGIKVPEKHFWSPLMYMEPIADI